MASIGHIAVGMVAGRQRWQDMLAWSALAMLPDADVIAFAMGVPYSAPWGHRGAAHSLVFAVLVGSAIAGLAPRFHRPRFRTWWTTSLVLASHGLLDTLTDGGLGVALLWPFDLTRYFAPWRPIPVSPIGLAFLSPYGLFVATTELALFAPLIAFALRRPRVGVAFVSMWAIVVWLIASSDPIREAALGIVLRENTEYAKGYSEHGFRAIAVGQSIDEARARAGEPIGQWWDYFSDDAAANHPTGCPFVYLESDVVVTEANTVPVVTTLCEAAGIHAGMPRADVLRVLGQPRGVCWRYTRSPTHAFHRGRVVCFENGKVADVIRRWGRM